MRYVVWVQWMVRGKRDYLRRTKRFEITAPDILAASAAALAAVGDVICPAVTSCWYVWPQPKEPG